MLAYWHAIMHRREGDFSNSKYWYARCADHPVMKILTPAAEDLGRQGRADKSIFRLTAHGWHPEAFVDLVEAVYEKPTDPRHDLAVALQRLEWRTMLDATIRAAVG